MNEEEFKNILKDRFTNLILVSKYTGTNTKLLLKDSYGIVQVYGNSLTRKNFKVPSIRSAINKTEYFKNKIKYINKNIEILGEYKNNSTKVLVKINNEKYLIKPNDLLMGHLPKNQSSINKNEYFLELIPKELKNKYDYSQVNYINSKTKVKVICPIHGEFEQLPYNILNKAICFKCSRKINANDGVYNIKIAEYNKIKWSKRKAKVYFVKMYNNKESFYKIGITTTTIKRRFSIINNYKYDYIKHIDTNLYNAVQIEKYYHTKLKNYKYNPSEYFAGYTECFTKII